MMLAELATAMIRYSDGRVQVSAAGARPEDAYQSREAR